MLFKDVGSMSVCVSALRLQPLVSPTPLDDSKDGGEGWRVLLLKYVFIVTHRSYQYYNSRNLIRKTSISLEVL